MDSLNPAGTASSTPNASVDKPVCVFCGRSFSQYTCPSCNGGYCSLTCYRSEAHNQCTELFYRKAVEDQIRSEPNKSTEDRRKMMEMLKRLEEKTPAEDDLDDEDESDLDEDAGDASLSKRLADVNIDDVDPKALWSLLNEEERAEFATVFQDPQGTKALELLEQHDVDSARFEPWWTVYASESNVVAAMPNDIVPLPNLPSGPTTTDSSKFAFNLFSICLAYAFTTRHLVVSPLASLMKPDFSKDDIVAARNDMAQAAPFLVDRKSTIIFSSVDQVITEIWSRMDAISTSGLTRLLGDTITLLQPSRVGAMPSGQEDTPPLAANLHTVLADVRTLFLTQSPSAGESDTADGRYTEAASKHEGAKLDGHVNGGGNNHVTLKLIFYAAKASAVRPDTYDQLRAAIRRKISKLEVESQGLPTATDAGDPRSSAPVPVPGAGLIVDSNTSSAHMVTKGKALIQEIS